MVIKTNVNLKPMNVIAMAGLILTLFEKNKYCANQIAAVIELVTKRFEEHRNLEPISFDNINGKVKEIKVFEAEANNLFVLTVKFRKDFYYVADLHGSLSKNIADSMIFINKENALTYAGDLEAKLEEKFMMPISVYVKEIS